MVTEHHPRSERIVNLDEPIERLLIVDDHRFMAESLASILRDRGLDARVVVGATPHEILEEVASAGKCLVLLDLALTSSLGSGLDLLPLLISAGGAVAVLTGSTSHHDLGRCYELGAVGVISKSLPMEAVLDMIEQARCGALNDTSRRLQLLRELKESRREADLLQAPFRALTAKEGEVLEMLASGLTAQDIVEEIYISMSTVRSHVRSILMKLGVHSQLAAVAKARECNWLH